MRSVFFSVFIVVILVALPIHLSGSEKQVPICNVCKEKFEKIITPCCKLSFCKECLAGEISKAHNISKPPKCPQCKEKFSDEFVQKTIAPVCPICQYPCTNKITTPCKQNFCAECLKEAVKYNVDSKKYPECPLCRKKFSVDFLNKEHLVELSKCDKCKKLTIKYHLHKYGNASLCKKCEEEEGRQFLSFFDESEDEEEGPPPRPLTFSGSSSDINQQDDIHPSAPSIEEMDENDNHQPNLDSREEEQRHQENSYEIGERENQRQQTHVQWHPEFPYSPGCVISFFMGLYMPLLASTKLQKYTPWQIPLWKRFASSFPISGATAIISLLLFQNWEQSIHALHFGSVYLFSGSHIDNIIVDLLHLGLSQELTQNRSISAAWRTAFFTGNILGTSLGGSCRTMQTIIGLVKKVMKK
ncbi:MAG: hypothetical protein JW725_02035 [Candidatus Babeliaceae bacterium]|nr:hypothetical protein [Candidatus Babeliaceae bacterium]